MFKVKNGALIKGGLAMMLLSLLVFSCTMPNTAASGSVDETAVSEDSSRATVNGEVFEMTNYPEFVSVQTITDLNEMHGPGRVSYLSSPWNYEKAENSSRSYPLVIYLHSSATRYRLDWLLSRYLGNGNDANAQYFKSNYPAFIYFPFADKLINFDGDSDAIINDIETLIKKRRIDPERVYLIGFENGSDATLELTRRYNNDVRGFAGVVKLSGQTALQQIEDVEQAFSRTSIWINSANQDKAPNVTAAQESFQLLKSHYSSEGVYSSTTQSVLTRLAWNDTREVPCQTETINVGGVEKVKFSTYGNETTPITHLQLREAPLQNPELYNWLFQQKRVGKETFDPADDPALMTYTDNGRTYQIRKPWNYDKAYNRSRAYPLVIYLHPSTPVVKHYHLPRALGNGLDQIAIKFRQDYPSFLYYPHSTTPSSGFNADLTAMVDDIERLIRENRIDPSRIYLIGYSMGSSGTIDLSRAFNNSDRAFAGVIRLSGHTALSMVEDVQNSFSRSPVWNLTSGGDHLKSRTAAITSYQLYKDYYPNGVESRLDKEDDFRILTKIDGQDAYVTQTIAYWTKIYSVNGEEKYRYTYYDEGNTTFHHGHLSGYPYQDPELLSWLFSRRLK